MLMQTIKSRLCSDFVVEIDESEGQSAAITSFSYPDGDSVTLYFQDVDGMIAVSDEGATVSFLKNQQVELTPERREQIKVMCLQHGVSFQESRLVKQFPPEDAGSACLSFCEAVTRVSSIHYHSSSQFRSPLPIAVSKLLHVKVEPVREVTRKWTDPQFDRKGSFPVDFHVNGIGEPRNIFYVTSAGKGLMVSAVVHFLRSHLIDVPTMTIVESDIPLGNRAIDRLQLASTEIRFGLEKHEDDVVKFALGK